MKTVFFKAVYVSSLLHSLNVLLVVYTVSSKFTQVKKDPPSEVYDQKPCNLLVCL